MLNVLQAQGKLHTKSHDQFLICSEEYSCSSPYSTTFGKGTDPQRADERFTSKVFHQAQRIKASRLAHETRGMMRARL